MENEIQLPPTRKKRRWLKRILQLFGVFILVVLVALGIYYGRLYYLLKTGQVTPAMLLGLEETAAVDVLTIATPDDPAFGPLEAKVVIVEFSDFECPFCGEFQPVINQVKTDFGDQVRLIYRDFPLYDIHPNAVRAALAGECAHEQGKFWQMHDKLFANQTALTEADLKRYAVGIGLNSLQFGTCMDEGKYITEIEDDFRAGVAAGIEATPTIFINGRRVQGVIPYPQLRQIIVDELNKQL